MKLQRRQILMICCLGAALIVLAIETLGQTQFLGSTITGTAYAVGGPRAGRSAPFKLIINKFTSADEVQRLNQALQSSGQDELLKTLSKMDGGRIVIGTGVGVPANAIIASTQEGGETKLTVVWERNIGFSELRYGARRADYRFGYAEIYLKASGQGEGTLIPAAKVRLRDGNTWEVEDFGTFPVRLMGLRARGGRAPG